MAASTRPAPRGGGRPELSVVIPVYNTAEPLVARALASAAAIGDEGIEVEIVAVDDGSVPDCAATTARLLDACAGGNVAVRHVLHPANAGLASARNTGIVQASGRWIVFLDSDDALVPGALAGMLGALRDATEKVVCFQSAHAGATGATGPATPAHRALAAAAAGRGPARPQNLPELALIPSSWSQAYDRAWLVAEGLRYDPALRRWEDRPFLVATQLAAPGGIRVWPAIVHHHFVDTGGSITKRGRTAADAEMMLRHVAQVGAALEAAGLADSAYAGHHWWISLSRLLSVAGPGAAGDRALRARVQDALAGLARRPPRDPAGGGIRPPHPALPVSRLPAPLRAALLALLARAGHPLARGALGAVFGLLDLRRRLAKRIPA